MKGGVDFRKRKPEILDNSVRFIELKPDVPPMQDYIFVRRQEANGFKHWFDKDRVEKDRAY